MSHRLKTARCPPAHLAPALALALALALLAAPTLAAAASLRVLTDVWGGSGNGNIAQGCTTYGPIPDLGAFFNGGGWRAQGGNTACGYTGVTADLGAASGALLSQQGLPPVALDNSGSSFQGAAGARAAFGTLGVAASGVHTGSSGGTSAVFATGAAFFHDSLTASSPLVAPASAGFVRYVFGLDGQLAAPSGQRGTASVQLSLQQGSGPVLGLGRLTVQAGEVASFSAIDGTAAGWALGAGTVAGAGSFGSTVHVPFFGDVDLPMTWGSPWDVTVGLLATTAHTADAAFLASARLVEVQLFDAAHQRIGNAVLSAASGTGYGASPVPEPQAWALWAAGLAALAGLRRRGVAAPADSHAATGCAPTGPPPPAA